VKTRKFGETHDMRGGDEKFVNKISRKFQKNKVVDWIEVA
jgi:hypothetical protein